MEFPFTVNPPKTVNKVSISADKTSARPGETIHFTIKAYHNDLIVPNYTGPFRKKYKVIEHLTTDENGIVEYDYVFQEGDGGLPFTYQNTTYESVTIEEIIE